MPVGLNFGLIVKKKWRIVLEVVGNKKWGGSGGRQLFQNGFGQWRSISVCFLILSSSSIESISVSASLRKIISQLAWHQARRTEHDHLTYILSANTGTPMHLAPKVIADPTQKKSGKQNFNIIGAPCLVSMAYWQRGTSVRQNSHRLIHTSVRLAYFHANRLFNWS